MISAVRTLMPLSDKHVVNVFPRVGLKFK